MLKANFSQLRVVEKGAREGFASTVNTGVAVATGDIVVLLNSDVEPEKNFLPPLVAHFKDQSVFAVGCMDKSIEGSRMVLRGRGIGQWRRGFYVHRRGEVDVPVTDWVSGGSGAFRKSIWEKLGGMDPLFNPFYWEDIDLSYRAAKLGYKLIFENKSIVRHFHEEGKIKTGYSQFFIRIIASRNQFLFAWKHIEGASNKALHVLWTPVMLARALLTLDVAMAVGFIAAVVRKLAH